MYREKKQNKTKKTNQVRRGERAQTTCGPPGLPESPEMFIVGSHSSLRDARTENLPCLWACSSLLLNHELSNLSLGSARSSQRTHHLWSLSCLPFPASLGQCSGLWKRETHLVLTFRYLNPACGSWPHWQKRRQEVMEFCWVIGKCTLKKINSIKGGYDGRNK